MTAVSTAPMSGCVTVERMKGSSMAAYSLREGADRAAAWGGTGGMNLSFSGNGRVTILPGAGSPAAVLHADAHDGS